MLVLVRLHLVFFIAVFIFFSLLNAVPVCPLDSKKPITEDCMCGASIAKLSYSREVYCCPDYHAYALKNSNLYDARYFQYSPCLPLCEVSGKKEDGLVTTPCMCGTSYDLKRSVVCHKGEYCCGSFPNDYAQIVSCKHASYEINFRAYDLRLKDSVTIKIGSKTSVFTLQDVSADKAKFGIISIDENGVKKILCSEADYSPKCAIAKGKSTGTGIAQLTVLPNQDFYNPVLPYLKKKGVPVVRVYVSSVSKNYANLKKCRPLDGFNNLHVDPTRTINLVFIPGNYKQEEMATFIEKSKEVMALLYSFSPLNKKGNNIINAWYYTEPVECEIDYSTFHWYCNIRFAFSSDCVFPNAIENVLINDDENAGGISNADLGYGAVSSSSDPRISVHELGHAIFSLVDTYYKEGRKYYTGPLPFSNRWSIKDKVVCEKDSDKYKYGKCVNVENAFYRIGTGGIMNNHILYSYFDAPSRNRIQYVLNVVKSSSTKWR